MEYYIETIIDFINEEPLQFIGIMAGVMFAGICIIVQFGGGL